MKIPDIVKKAHKEAVAVRKKTYSPYSNFGVGSALVTSKDKIYSGTNIENASYGGTICAERVAIVEAVKNGDKKFTHIVVVTDTKMQTPPCGMCRQVMAEFFDDKTQIWIGDLKEVKSVYTFKELLPEAFGPKNLL
jgi:cytidine deaminase